MKNCFILLFASCIIFYSCKEAKKEQESITETAIESSELEKYTDKFRKLIITEDGILRGFTFITDSSEIKKNENAQLFSSSPSGLQYTIEFNELEMADIIYHLKGNEIDTFEIDLYLKDKPSTDSLLQDFKKFYTAKYGSVETDSDSLVTWKDSVKNVAVSLKYINKDIDHGINVHLYQNESQSRKVIQ